MATWPSDEELSKLSDEHKAMLAQKCVRLLMRKCTTEDASLEVLPPSLPPSIECHVPIISKYCMAL